MTTSNIIAQEAPTGNGHLSSDIQKLLGYGRKYARTGKDLAKALGFKDDRLIRYAIRELIAQGLPIASSVTPPYGYYIVTTHEEAQNYIRVLQSRLVEDAYRRRDFKLAARDKLQPGQLVLF